MRSKRGRQEGTGTGMKGFDVLKDVVKWIFYNQKLQRKSISQNRFCLDNYSENLKGFVK